MGLFPKLGGIIAAMPESVIGGAAIIMFGMIAGAGIKLSFKIRNESKKHVNSWTFFIFWYWECLFQILLKTFQIFGISLKLLLTTGLIPAGIISICFKCIMAKK